jgi:hypothetical protein
VLSGFALGADLALPPALLAGVIGRAGHAGRARRLFRCLELGRANDLALAAGIALPLLGALGYVPRAGRRHRRAGGRLCAAALRTQTGWRPPCCGARRCVTSEKGLIMKLLETVAPAAALPWSWPAAVLAGSRRATYARTAALDRTYFNGTLDAHGMFQDRSGAVVKRFVVVMRCSWVGDTAPWTKTSCTPTAARRSACGP